MKFYIATSFVKLSWIVYQFIFFVQLWWSFICWCEKSEKFEFWSSWKADIRFGTFIETWLPRLPPFLPRPFKRLVGREGDLLMAKASSLWEGGKLCERNPLLLLFQRIMAFRATNVAKWCNKPLRYLLILSNLISRLLSAQERILSRFYSLSFYDLLFYYFIISENILINV